MSKVHFHLTAPLRISVINKCGAKCGHPLCFSLSIRLRCTFRSAINPRPTEAFLPLRSYNSVATCAAASSFSASGPFMYYVTSVLKVSKQSFLTKSPWWSWYALNIISLLAVSSLISSGFNLGRLWENISIQLCFNQTFFCQRSDQGNVRSNEAAARAPMLFK